MIGKSRDPELVSDSRRIAYGEVDAPTAYQGSGNEVIRICEIALARFRYCPVREASGRPAGRLMAATWLR